MIYNNNNQQQLITVALTATYLQLFALVYLYVSLANERFYVVGKFMYVSCTSSGKPVAVTHAHGKERLWHPLNASNHSSEKSPCGKCCKDGMESSDVHQNMTETFNLGDGDARPGIEALASDHCLGTVCKRGSGFSGGESFHSMAEIASCSYEAREVNLHQL